MPQLRHVAITTHDVEKTAKFYIDVFGMEDVATSLPTHRRPRQRWRVPLVGGRRRPR